MGVCNCSVFCCMLLYVRSSIAIILMGKRELVALLNLSSWCLVMVERLFLAVPRDCLQFVIVVFPDHTHLLFLNVKEFRNHLQFLQMWHVAEGILPYGSNGIVLEKETPQFLVSLETAVWKVLNLVPGYSPV